MKTSILAIIILFVMSVSSYAGHWEFELTVDKSSYTQDESVTVLAQAEKTSSTSAVLTSYAAVDASGNDTFYGWSWSLAKLKANWVGEGTPTSTTVAVTISASGIASTTSDVDPDSGLPRITTELSADAESYWCSSDFSVYQQSRIYDAPGYHSVDQNGSWYLDFPGYWDIGTEWEEYNETSQEGLAAQEYTNASDLIEIHQITYDGQEIYVSTGANVQGWVFSGAGYAEVDSGTWQAVVVDFSY